MNMDAIREFFIWLWYLAGVKFIVCHTLINVVVAIVAALHNGEFKLYKIAEFLTKKLLPYVVIYGIAKAIGADAGLDWLAAAAFTLIEVALAADLAENLGKLGIPMPDRLKRAVDKRPHAYVPRGR